MIETGRFAPSPSGRMHLGNALSGLIAWLDARSQGGQMLLRIEDLDPQRSKAVYTEQIISDLAWLGLDWDMGPVYQSHRRHIYQQWIEVFTGQNVIYPCSCSRNELLDATAPHPGQGEGIYKGKCALRPAIETIELAQGMGRSPALRLRVPHETLHFTDMNYGLIEQDLALTCGDFIVRRTDGIHAYQLAVSVDDALLGVTRVVRGVDLLPSVGRQMYIHKLMGYEPPQYGHVPLMVGPDGVRLSKRNLATDLGYWRNLGLEPEKLVGFIAHKIGILDAYEPVRPKDLIGTFSWDRLAKANIIIDSEHIINDFI